MKWEYKTLLLMMDNDPETDERMMNEVGEEGWELVSAFRVPDGGHYLYFKRPLPN